jgi:D-alanine-D-alanine ligase-like ATP-grasp enzyme
LDLGQLRDNMIELQPDIVFNLVESLGSTDRLMVLSTILLDTLQMPYTGARTDAILETSNKVKAKERLFAAGLPTPQWICAKRAAKLVQTHDLVCAGSVFSGNEYAGNEYAGNVAQPYTSYIENGQSHVRGNGLGRRNGWKNGSHSGRSRSETGRGNDQSQEWQVVQTHRGARRYANSRAGRSLNGNGHGGTNGKGYLNGNGKEHRWIVKPIWEHASFGMDDSAVISAPDVGSIESICDERQARLGRPHFAERFIDGREFNLSILAGEVLPHAEIDFSSFPNDRPRILGYRAKWDPAAIEYQQTPRRFDFPASDAELLNRLSDYARRCWELFGLHGYARVDFRVDRGGQPFVLEVNTNPCLSPDAGFAAALAQAGIAYPDAIQRILDDSMPN